MKKIISTTIAAALAASMSVPAFANLTPDGEPVIQDDIMLLNLGEEVPGDEVIGEADAETPIVVLPGQSETAPLFTSETITVTDIRDTTGTDYDDILVRNGLVLYEGGSVRLTLTDIFDINGEKKTTDDVKVGDVIVTFTAKNHDIPSFAVITSEDAGTTVALDKFTVSETLGEYVDTQNFLAINVSEDTEIVDVDGNELTKDDIADNYLMVFYSTMTMSIPAITNPSKIIVLGSLAGLEKWAETLTEEPTDEQPDAPQYEYEFVVDGEDAITEEDGVIIIPVRKYAEGLGLEVNWNGEDQSVTVGTIPMGVSFKIGENSYSKARMTPFVLEVAPQLINGLTYVPVSFFEQVIEAAVKIAK